MTIGWFEKNVIGGTELDDAPVTVITEVKARFFTSHLFAARVGSCACYGLKHEVLLDRE